MPSSCERLLVLGCNWQSELLFHTQVSVPYRCRWIRPDVGQIHIGRATSSLWDRLIPFWLGEERRVEEGGSEMGFGTVQSNWLNPVAVSCNVWLS